MQCPYCCLLQVHTLYASPHAVRKPMCQFMLVPELPHAWSNTVQLAVQALQRLTEAAEKAKMELSSVANTSISLPFITATADGPKHIESNLSRAKFESICSDLLDRCRIPVEQALKDAKLKLSDLNEVRHNMLT